MGRRHGESVCCPWFRVSRLWVAVVVCLVSTQTVAADLVVDGVDFRFAGDATTAYMVHLGSEELSSALTVAEGEMLADANQAVLMTAHDGRRYFCRLPIDDDDGANGESDDENDENDEKTLKQSDAHAASRVSQTQSLEKKLEQHHDNSCFHRVEGWWTYELCYRKHVRQYHTEGAGASATVSGEFSLGRFDNEATRANNFRKSGDASDASETTGNELTDSLTHVFTGGTPCDLTPLQRETSVVYRCSGGGDDSAGAGIVSITEPATCRYLLTFVTPALCDRQGKHQVAQTKKDIKCRPIDDSSPDLEERRTGGADEAGDGRDRGEL